MIIDHQEGQNDLTAYDLKQFAELNVLLIRSMFCNLCTVMPYLVDSVGLFRAICGLSTNSVPDIQPCLVPCIPIISPANRANNRISSNKRNTFKSFK